MLEDFTQLLDSYNYTFPEELIASVPAIPRDSARLLVYNRECDTIIETTFHNLPDYLPEKTLLVLNETKVLPARVRVARVTGGHIKLLYIEQQAEKFLFLANKKLDVGETLYYDRVPVFLVAGILEKGYLLEPYEHLDVENFLEQYGKTPLPPYIKYSELSEEQRRSEYQTVFAKNSGSVAAPTASLHFTPELLDKLKDCGVRLEFVTLHVGLGTFASLTEKAVQSNKLHEEWYTITSDVAERINSAKRDGWIIIPVGTTALRTLESAATDGMLTKLSGRTSLFIRPGYSFQIARGLITNFHVPKSSLMMLVAALVGREKLLSLYAYAIKQRFRFFSFGDGMLVW